MLGHRKDSSVVALGFGRLCLVHLQEVVAAGHLNKVKAVSAVVSKIAIELVAASL